MEKISRLIYFILVVTINSYLFAFLVTSNTPPQKNVRMASGKPLPTLSPAIVSKPLTSIPKASCLEFVHITKTGGTAIESIAAASGIPWGACHARRELPTCKGLAKTAHSPTSYSDWHNPRIAYKCNNLFTIVRNPYTRILSWFYCPWEGYNREEPVTPSVFNKWLQKSISKIEQSVSFHGKPQYEYVFDERGAQRVKHVLHYENLEHEFNALMQAYNMSLRYSSKSINPSKWQHRNMSIHDLSIDTLELIHRVYNKDFAKFGYKMLPMSQYLNKNDLIQSIPVLKPCIHKILSRVQFPSQLPAIDKKYGIDAIFVLHYKPLVHRKSEMLHRIRSVFNTSCIWIEDLDKSELSDLDITCVSNRSLQRNYINRFTKRGEDSLSLKHMAVFNFILTNNLRNALILEDDARFLQLDWLSESSQWQTILRELPVNYDLVMLSAFENLARQGKQVGKHLFLAQSSRVSSMYLVSQKGAHNMLRTLPIIGPFDFQINYAGGHLIPDTVPPASVLDINILWAEPAMSDQYDILGGKRTVDEDR